jgi:hypothetical protein
MGVTEGLAPANYWLLWLWRYPVWPQRRDCQCWNIAARLVLAMGHMGGTTRNAPIWQIGGTQFVWPLFAQPGLLAGKKSFLPMFLLHLPRTFLYTKHQ